MKDDLIRVIKLSKTVSEGLEKAEFGEIQTKNGDQQVTARLAKVDLLYGSEVIRDKNLTVYKDTVNGLLCLSCKDKDDIFATYNTELIHDAVDSASQYLPDDGSDDCTTSQFQKLFDKKSIPAKKEYVVPETKGGSFGPYYGHLDMAVMAEDDIWVRRDGKWKIDNSIHASFQEISKLNGTYNKEETRREDINVLLRSLTTKASELLMPIMGDSIAVVLRRLMTLDSMITYMGKEKPEVLKKFLQEFYEDVEDRIEKHSEELTPLQLQLFEADKELDYKEKYKMAEAIREEKGMMSSLIRDGEHIDRPVNYIDLAFVAEMLDNGILEEEDADSFANQTMELYAVATTGITAGARAMYSVHKSLYADYYFADGDLGPAITASNKNSQEDIEIDAVNDVFEWMDDEYGDEIDVKVIRKEYMTGGKSFKEIFDEELETIGKKKIKKTNLITGEKKEKQKGLRDSILKLSDGSKSSKKKYNIFEDDEDEDDDDRRIIKNKNKSGGKKMRLGLSSIKSKNEAEFEKVYVEGKAFYLSEDETEDTRKGEMYILFDRNEDEVGYVHPKSFKVFDDRMKVVGIAAQRKEDSYAEDDDDDKSSRFGKGRSSSRRKSSRFEDDDEVVFSSKKKKRNTEQEINIGKSRKTYFLTEEVVRTDEGKGVAIVDSRNKVVAVAFDDGYAYDSDLEELGKIYYADDSDDDDDKSTFGKGRSSSRRKSSSFFDDEDDDDYGRGGIFSSKNKKRGLNRLSSVR